MKISENGSTVYFGNLNKYCLLKEVYERLENKYGNTLNVSNELDALAIKLEANNEEIDFDTYVLQHLDQLMEKKKNEVSNEESQNITNERKNETVINIVEEIPAEDNNSNVMENITKEEFENSVSIGSRLNLMKLALCDKHYDDNNVCSDCPLSINGGCSYESKDKETQRIAHEILLLLVLRKGDESKNHTKMIEKALKRELTEEEKTLIS